VYRQICLGTADDPAVLALFADTPARQQRPVLLLAAVHDLLLGGLDHPLARWYPTVNGGRTPPDDDPFSMFRDLVLGHANDVLARLATRATQTNEVNRSCLWFAALRAASADQPDRPISLIEVGAAAGLNLLVDQYQYNYWRDTPGDGIQRGNPASKVALRCQVIGAQPPVNRAAPPIAHRVGIDPQPIDVFDLDAVRWLQACVWPEQLERHQRFVAAVETARLDPPTVVPGDAVADIDSVVATAGADHHVVVINSWVLTYLATDRRAAFEDALDRIGRVRDLTWVSAEHPHCLGAFDRGAVDADNVDYSLVGMRTWRSGQRTTQHVATIHPHLQWIRWADRAR